MDSFLLRRPASAGMKTAVVLTDSKRAITIDEMGIRKLMEGENN